MRTLLTLEVKNAAYPEGIKRNPLIRSDPSSNLKAANSGG